MKAEAVLQIFQKFLGEITLAKETADTLKQQRYDLTEEDAEIFERCRLDLGGTVDHARTALHKAWYDTDAFIDALTETVNEQDELALNAYVEAVEKELDRLSIP